MGGAGRVGGAMDPWPATAQEGYVPCVRHNKRHRWKGQQHAYSERWAR